MTSAPPSCRAGTGKTSLCRALAQKLAIRLGRHYAAAQLVEVNAHSLFSRWFSQSGKMVSRLFARIREALDEADTLVFVLVDEVESLAMARSAAAGGGEPGDAVRAVNALLTQLDQLRAYSNCMVLTTSNLTGSIDLAFVDRADIKAFIGPPGRHARYEILRSSLGALQAAGIVAGGGAAAAPAFADVLRAHEAGGGGAARESTGMQLEGDVAAEAAAEGEQLGVALLGVADAAEGFSGRALRKLPFLAHAGADFPGGGACGAVAFMRALAAAVGREREDRAALEQA
jgi:SpoVK/Ycf46/Vps4 family AAA+-type ATPase